MTVEERNAQKPFGNLSPGLAGITFFFSHRDYVLLKNKPFLFSFSLTWGTKKKKNVVNIYKILFVIIINIIAM